MLIQFTFSNVLSFKGKFTLDMAAINAYKEHSYNLIDIGQKEKFLKVAAIYGANASGKSNLFFAFLYNYSLMARALSSAASISSLSPGALSFCPQRWRMP